MTIYAAGNLIETFSSGSLPALYIGRLVAGVGVGALTVGMSSVIIPLAVIVLT
jgi:hypothetical protein